MTGRLVVCSLLAALLALPMHGCNGGSSEEVETSDKVPVTVQPVRKGSIRSVVAATGVVKPAPGAELLVTAPQSARILELPKTEGDQVRKGDLLARFEIPALDAEAAGRQSDLSRAEARLENARAAATRIAGLFDRGIAARKEVEEARRELAEAEAGVSEAQSGRKAADLLARRETVRALFDGIVAGRWHNPGDLVEAGSGDPILRVIDPARLQVEALVPLNELSRVAVGNPARVLPPGSYPPQQAAVLSRPAAVDPSTAAAAVRLSFSNPTRLPAGTPVQVEILAEEHSDVLLVPSGAIVREGSDSFLFTVDAEGRAHRRKVNVGITSGGQAEILSEVSAGERVIVRGQEGLPDGAAVTVNP